MIGRASRTGRMDRTGPAMRSASVDACRWARRLRLSLFVVLLAVAAGSGRAEPEDGSARPLRVVAAASLTEVVEALALGFEAERVETSFGASSDLARQIRDGAPADVFVSASPDWIDFLREAGAIVGEPVVVARNALVCVATRGGALARAGVRDPRALLARLAPGDGIAIADEGVPAGEYARRALARLGLLADFESRLVGQKDVRSVLHAVEQGELVAGFVYATDAKIARVETLFAFDPAAHPPIEYQAVVLRDADDPEAARRFLAYLTSDAARARLSAAGFVLP
jgi:molybdate transport system substrate-binding protein